MNELNRRALFRSVLAASLMAASCLALAQKTISYYSDNVGERIDQYLACQDGAQDPNLLACRNASASRRLDRTLVQRHATDAALEDWGTKGVIAKDPAKRAYQVLRLIAKDSRNSTCIALEFGKPPQATYQEKIYLAALSEKLIERVSGQSNVYRATKRGEEFLASQGDAVQNGYFCATNFGFNSRTRLLETQDLTPQYKGKKAGIFMISKLQVYSIEFDLENTGASVWFARKVSPNLVLPMTGKVITKTIVMEFEGNKGEFTRGGIFEIGGKVLGDSSIEKLLERIR